MRSSLLEEGDTLQVIIHIRRHQWQHQLDPQLSQKKIGKEIGIKMLTVEFEKLDAKECLLHMQAYVRLKTNAFGKNEEEKLFHRDRP